MTAIQRPIGDGVSFAALTRRRWTAIREDKERDGDVEGGNRRICSVVGGASRVRWCGAMASMVALAGVELRRQRLRARRSGAAMNGCEEELRTTDLVAATAYGDGWATDGEAASAGLGALTGC